MSRQLDDVKTLEQGRWEGVKGKEAKEEGRLEWRREEGEETGRWDCEMWEGNLSKWEGAMWEGNDEKGGCGRRGSCGRAEPNVKIRKM